MLSFFLAIGSAFFYGLSNVISRVGLRGSNTISGVLITQISSTAAALAICLFTVPLDHLASWTAIMYFAIAGALGPLIARFLLYTGIDRVGASIATPAYETKPLFSVLAAMIILGEEFTISVGVGMVLITLGAVIIGSEESGGQIEKKWSRKDLVFPFVAGACYGIAHIFRKLGLNLIPDPILGATVQNVTAITFFPLLALAQRNRQRVSLKSKQAWLAFSLSGLSSITGQLFLFGALNSGKVVIVSPLSSTSALFVLILVALFLRKIERVTWKIVLGVLTIIGGTTILAL